MVERLIYNTTDKKLMLEALKNEKKYVKKIPVYKDDEVVGRIVDWEWYNSHISFILDEPMADYMVDKKLIKSLTIYDYKKTNGEVLKRVKDIIV